MDHVAPGPLGQSAPSSLADLGVILRPLFDGTHPEPFVTLRLLDDGALVQLL
jgi:hypothetical protein